VREFFEEQEGDYGKAILKMYGSEPSMKKTIGKYTLNYIMDSTFGPKYD
jgi:hypothetical protein